jgi:hypothetical protein
MGAFLSRWIAAGNRFATPETKCRRRTRADGVVPNNYGVALSPVLQNKKRRPVSRAALVCGSNAWPSAQRHAQALLHQVANVRPGQDSGAGKHQAHVRSKPDVETALNCGDLGLDGFPRSEFPAAM